MVHLPPAHAAHRKVYVLRLSSERRSRFFGHTTGAGRFPSDNCGLACYRTTRERAARTVQNSDAYFCAV